MLSRTTIGFDTTFDTTDNNILSIGLNDIGIGNLHGQVHSLFMYFVSSR